MTVFVFTLSCTLVLLTSLNGFFHSITIVKDAATSKVCRMGWLLYEDANVANQQGPSIEQTAILITWLFVHTEYANVANRAFIHTEYTNVATATRRKPRCTKRSCKHIQRYRTRNDYMKQHIEIILIFGQVYRQWKV